MLLFREKHHKNVEGGTVVELASGQIEKLQERTASLEKRKMHRLDLGSIVSLDEDLCALTAAVANASVATGERRKLQLQEAAPHSRRTS